MPDKERKKGKHLTLTERMEIQQGLREGCSFVEIALRIGCSPDTVSKEIRNHRYKKTQLCIAKQYRKPNRCKFRETCKRRNVCEKKPGEKCMIVCRKCFKCNDNCPHFVDAPCPIDHKAPYVCNGCSKRHSCLFQQYLYNAQTADREYQDKLKESRSGIDLSRDELASLDELVSPLIKKGQPLAHIMETHKDEIPCGIRTLYRYIGEGYLTARNIDMRRTVRYRKRKHYTKQVKVSFKKKAGHKYEDYLAYMEKNPESRVVQMDTVEGIKGGKLLQTFLWPENNLMLAYLIDSKEMVNAVGIFNRLEECLGTELFRELFSVVLTDNGCEFADPEVFERGINGERRTKLFYCEPRHSEQKGQLEKNHEYIRYVLPKGSSFDELTQEKVLLMLNHINNTTRPKLHGNTPMKQALKSFGKNAMDKLGLIIIQPDDICLSPELMK